MEAAQAGPIGDGRHSGGGQGAGLDSAVRRQPRLAADAADDCIRAGRKQGCISARLRPRDLLRKKRRSPRWVRASTCQSATTSAQKLHNKAISIFVYQLRTIQLLLLKLWHHCLLFNHMSADGLKIMLSFLWCGKVYWVRRKCSNTLIFTLNFLVKVKLEFYSTQYNFKSSRRN